MLFCIYGSDNLGCNHSKKSTKSPSVRSSAQSYGPGPFPLYPTLPEDQVLASPCPDVVDKGDVCMIDSIIVNYGWKSSTLWDSLEPELTLFPSHPNPEIYLGDKTDYQAGSGSEEGNCWQFLQK